MSNSAELNIKGTAFITAGGRLFDVWPSSPDEKLYTSVRNSNVETLLIGGRLDVATPPQNASRELLPHLPNGHEVVLPDVGHTDDFWTYQTPASNRLINTFLDSGPQGNVNTAGATFSFSSSDGAASFLCKLDLGAFGPCTSPHTYADVGQGSHTFTVKAVDPATNEDPTPATRMFTVTGSTLATPIQDATQTF